MENQKTQQEVLRWASSFLKENECEENIAYVVMEHYLDLSRTELLMQMDQVISADKYEVIRQAIYRHVESKEPIQHIIGQAPFYGREFLVNKNVLIPRFETEELVEKVLQVIDRLSLEHIRLVDLGTGSGVIAITLKLERPQVSVYATDISGQALEVAMQNAARHGADIKFLQGDFLEPMIEADLAPTIVISNPPYIAQSEYEQLSQTVRNYDPHLALFAEDNGLSAYKKIIEQSKRLPQARLHAFLFEIGYAQKEAVTQIVNETYPQGELEMIKDISGKDRIILKYLQ